MTIFKAACVQMNAPNNLRDSIEQAECLIQKAIDNGAELIVTPENTSGIVYGKGSEERRRDIIHEEENHPALISFQAIAQKHKVALIIGSLIVIPSPKAKAKATNRCYFIDQDGTISYHYDKIHLFDAKISSSEHYLESELYEGGTKAVVVPFQNHIIGLTICYDVRFPHLFQSLSDAGALLITVPAAFTRPTGEVHWQTLLQARAIENACYILASAQWGEHDGGRTTWGHSMIIDPWGKILCEAEDGTGVISATIDSAKQEEALAKIPVIDHRRLFTAAII